MILQYTNKTVNARVALCLRAVADFFESEWGYHLWMIPLPTDENQLKAMVSGGGALSKVNANRTKAGLFPVGENFNVKYADKSWTGLIDGSGVFFRICHNQTLAHAEFCDIGMTETISKIVAEHGKKAEILNNEQYSIVYIYEPTSVPE